MKLQWESNSRFGGGGNIHLNYDPEIKSTFKSRADIKFLTDEENEAIKSTMQAQAGDLVLIVADKNKVVLPVLGALRSLLGKKLELIPEGKFNFLWITEFPFFEWNEETQHWDAMHHPFTMPLEECLPMLESDPGSVRAKCYDMVLNGANPQIEVNPETFDVTINGQRIDVKPAKSFSLGQLYWFS